VYGTAVTRNQFLSVTDFEIGRFYNICGTVGPPQRHLRSCIDAMQRKISEDVDPASAVTIRPSVYSAIAKCTALRNQSDPVLRAFDLEIGRPLYTCNGNVYLSLFCFPVSSSFGQTGGQNADEQSTTQPIRTVA